MANLGYSLRSAFGLIPKTDKIESINQTLKDEFERLNTYAESEELKEYLELESYINSPEFIEFKKNILSLDFKQTEEFQKEKQFFKLQKDKRITNYFKVLASNEYKELVDTEESETLADYNNLKDFLSSDKYESNKTELANNLKSEQQKNKTYIQLKKLKEIKEYYKTLNSNQLKLYNELTDSGELNEYLELEEFVNSNQLSEFKIEIGKTLKDEQQKNKELIQQKKSKKFKDYYKVLNSPQLTLYNELTDSEELKEYQKLEKFVVSDELKIFKAENKTQLEAEKDKKKELAQLKKHHEIIAYNKLLKKQSQDEEVEKPQKLIELEELSAYINSNNYQQKLTELEYLNTEEFKKEQKFNSLIKNKRFKNYFKFANSKQLADFLSLNNSDELKIYENLDKYINSIEYKEKLESLKYTNTEEYKKEQKFALLKKEQKFKAYFKFKSSKQLADYFTMIDSDQLKQYEGLEAYVTSSEYTDTLNSLAYSNSDEFKKEQKFNELKNSDQIKNWIKYKKSKPYLLFLQINGSELLKEFEGLQKLIDSDKFKEYKAYMLDKQKFKKTDEYDKEQRYHELKKSDNVKWYYAIKDSNKFDELKAWNLTFEDDFTTKKIEEEKWMNSFFWGKMLLNDRYVLTGDKHFFTDNKNIELNGTSLKIVTKKEKTKGKVWHPVHGFSNQEFNYTSGMLSTAHSFRQLYGKIEAKIKVNADFPVYQAFWLKGEKILPEIDVFKFNMDKKNRFQMSTIWGDPANAKDALRKSGKINGANFTKGYFIYTLDWTENKLTWKINGIEVYSTTQGIPNEPLYMLLSAGMQKEPEQDFTPAAFEIDWVRCYEKV